MAKKGEHTMDTVPAHEQTIRDIESQIETMRHYLRDIGPFALPHVTVRIDRLEAEKQWIESHPRIRAAVLN